MNGFLLYPDQRVLVMVDGNAGKGDSYRKVDQKKWDEGWEAAFGKKKNKKKDVMQKNGVYDMTDIPQPDDIDILIQKENLRKNIGKENK